MNPLRRFRRPRRPSWRRLAAERGEVDTSVVSDRYRHLEAELFDHRKTAASEASTELMAAEFAARFVMFLVLMYHATKRVGEEGSRCSTQLCCDGKLKKPSDNSLPNPSPTSFFVSLYLFSDG